MAGKVSRADDAFALHFNECCPLVRRQLFDHEMHAFIDINGDGMIAIIPESFDVYSGTQPPSRERRSPQLRDQDRNTALMHILQREVRSGHAAQGG